METQLADLDDRLSDDRRIRTRYVRRDPLGRIVETLGTRPLGGKPSQVWDNAAGRLDQHQIAYGLETGLGPTRGPRLPIGFLHSRSLIQKLTNDLEQSITRQRHQEREVESPALGIGR